MILTLEGGGNYLSGYEGKGDTLLKLALKIDVDTYRGWVEGVPRLARALRPRGIPASFFVSLGPDRSGWAIRRFWRQPGFGLKMRRTRALSLYGWRTVLSGTLLPARPMARSFPGLLRSLVADGFEVGPHGYDHIRWHDEAAVWSEERARKEWTCVRETFYEALGFTPKSSAAPGWQTSPALWKVQDEDRLLYRSDTRGTEPYFPASSDYTSATLEIPTTLPTWDELLTRNDIWARLAEHFFGLLRQDQVNVWTLHAEIEGGRLFSEFESFINLCQNRGVAWVFLPAWAQALRSDPSSLHFHGIRRTRLEGRAGEVALAYG